MNISQIEQVLHLLGCSKIRPSGGNGFSSSCPFSLFTHRKGRDNNPSFYVRLNGDKPPGYSCQSCKREGTILNLVFELSKLTGERNKELYNYIRECNPVTEARLTRSLEKSKSYYKGSGYSFFNTPTSSPALELSIKPLVPIYSLIPEDHLTTFFKPIPTRVLNYLKGPDRKLTETTIAIWELCLGYFYSEEYIGIPIRDYAGGLVGITGRAVNQEKKPKYLNSENMPRNEVLFGENKATKGGRCYLVEGQFDVIWLWQCGYKNVLGVMGGHLSEVNANKIVEWYDEVVLVPDGDTAGSDALNKWKLLLQNRVHVIIAKAIDGKDPNKCSKELLEIILGKPVNKKQLTSWFASDKIVTSWQSRSLTIKKEEERQMKCSRCEHECVISESTIFGDGKDLKLYVGDRKILDIGIDNVCDSCVKDVQRIFRQLSAIPDIEIEKTKYEIEESIFG